MSIVDMQKVHIVSTKDSKNTVLQTLRESEVLDIQEIRNQDTGLRTEDTGQFDYQLAELKSAITFLETAEARKKSFIESFLPAKEETSRQELQRVCQEFDCRLMLKNTKDLEERLANLKNLTNDLSSRLTTLYPWQSLTVKLKDLNNMNKTKVTLGSIKMKNLESFRRELGRISLATTLELVSKTKENAFICLSFLTAEAEKINNFLTASEFNPTTLPLIDKTAKEQIKHLQNLLHESK
ncbi:MAG: hypothetical protein ABIH69_01255, partial [bacterium]